MSCTANPATSAYSVVGGLRFPPLSCATFGRARKVEYIDDRNIIATTLQRSTLVDCVVSKEEQIEMRKQAEIRQETEMKKEAVKKRDAKMEMEKRTESRKAEVEARKAERAERRRIALAQKEAPNLVQAQKSQAVTQPPDLGYDHELFGEDELGYVVVVDLDVAAQLEATFPSKKTTPIPKDAKLTPSSNQGSKRKPAISSSSRVRKAPKNSVSFAPTEDALRAAVTSATNDSQSDVNIKSQHTQLDPGLLEATLGDIGQSFQNDINSLSKKAPTKSALKKTPKASKTARPKSTAILDTLLAEMAKDPNVEPSNFHGWDIPGEFQKLPLHWPSAIMRRYIHCDGTVESVISGVNPDFPVTAAQSDTKALVEVCRTRVTTPYLVVVDDFDGEEIYDGVKLYDTVLDVSSSRMVVYEHADGNIDVVRTGIANVTPSTSIGELQRQVKSIELQIKTGTLPSPPQSAPKRKAGEDATKQENKRRKIDETAGDAPLTPRPTPRIKLLATGAKGRHGNLRNTKQDAAASSSPTSPFGEFAKENGQADNSESPIEKMRAMLPELTARVLNRSIEEDTSSSDDSSDSDDEETEIKPIAPRPQKKTTGAKRGAAAKKANPTSANDFDGAALDYSKKPSISVGGKKRAHGDDHIGDNGDTSEPAQRNKRARKA